jgi:neutral ceramidase
MTKLLALSLLLASPAVAAAPFQVGTARVCISPREPIWLAGYAARTHPSTGVAADLWAKALAIQDARGGKVVIVTMDLLRVPVADIATEVQRRYGLQRSQLLLNCAHNHSGPVLWEGDPFTALAPEEYEKSRRYTEHLTADLIELVGAALRNLAPASILHGTGEVDFAANRRLRTPSGYQIAYNPDGPTDRRVPVLKIAGADGKLRAVLFGYACHNTTVGPATYEVSGDYAGFAQAELERAHPGATALFLMLCAGDQDPYPRGGLDMAQRHGRELASAVERVMDGRLESLRGPLGTAFHVVDLALAPHTRETFEKRLNDPSGAVVRNARAMLKDYDEGHPIRTLSYPVQAVSFGRDLSLVALGGEPVVDYALRARSELPNAIVAGYSNSVKGYIPSKRVLAEGGYEGGDSMIYYGLPGPFTPAVEDTIFGAIKNVLREARR